MDAKAEPNYLEKAPEEVRRGVSIILKMKVFPLPDAIGYQEGHFKEHADHELAFRDAVFADVGKLSASKLVPQAHKFEHGQDAADPSQPELASPHRLGRILVAAINEKPVQ